ncbi:MAG: pyruvate:ferredoxin (flavodoxin) oxidoreductase, partial [Bacilli bacterium]|nr:pyruvate:ferredoxin (flavodoxin) oxidoreductase [Bacilli bacterium]
MAKQFMSMDGNTAAAYASYAFTEVAGIYPITPSSNMAEQVDAWASQGRKNLFNSIVKVTEMQSEAGAASACHGAVQAGALATTFTASQGLLLMIPTIYRLVGELRPAVIHVAARSLAARSLSIFGDHQDVYACRQTGIPMLSSHSVQEVMDLAGVAHLAAIKGQVPFMHFFDGFRTSHEIQKVELFDYADYARLIDRDKLKEFKATALNPHTNPICRGGAENDDVYFQSREVQNKHYDAIPDIVADYMKEVSKITGREYAPFTYYGSENATSVIVAMGSATESIKETINALNGNGYNVGLIKVHLYRPFSSKYLLEVLPKSVKEIAVLDRTKEVGAEGEPLYLDILAALKDTDIRIIGGRYGLSSKDFGPIGVKAVYDHLIGGGFHGFTVGIEDDVTNLSIPRDKKFVIPANYTSCLFYGLGSDGTVSANKNAIKIIGDHTDLYAQAYFAYDSKKAGGVTRSHLRFGNEPIHSTYYVKNIDFISCSLDSYIDKYNMLEDLKDGGTFLLNTTFKKEEIIANLPEFLKYQLASKNAQFYIIDATEIAQEIGMGRRTNTILQSSFFALNEQIMAYTDAVNYMKEAAKKSYSKKGKEIVELNYKAIDKGKDGLVKIDVDPEWAKLDGTFTYPKTGNEYFDNYILPI